MNSDTQPQQIDSSIDIITPENIAFRYQLAGPFRRLPALLIDVGIRIGVLILLSIVLTLFDILSFRFASGTLVAFCQVAWFLLEWFYGGLFETFMNGQTPGKRVMGIRVLTVDGHPINGLQAILRNILRFVDMMPIVPIPGLSHFPIFPVFLVGPLVAATNRRYQRLGDVVCGTMVVVEQRSRLYDVAKVKQPGAIELAAYLPANVQVGRSLAQALSTYVARRDNFSPPRRREIARHLGEPLVARFGLPIDTGHDVLLCALYYRAFVTDRVD